jgi:hypothetical protein
VAAPLRHVSQSRFDCALRQDGVDAAGKIALTRLQGMNLRGVFRFPVERYANELLPSQGVAITGTNG